MAADTLHEVSRHTTCLLGLLKHRSCANPRHISLCQQCSVVKVRTLKTAHMCNSRMSRKPRRSHPARTCQPLITRLGTARAPPRISTEAVIGSPLLHRHLCLKLVTASGGLSILQWTPRLMSRPSKRLRVTGVNQLWAVSETTLPLSTKQLPQTLSVSVSNPLLTP